MCSAVCHQPARRVADARDEVERYYREESTSQEAVTDADVLEASTPELDDVVRLEDRYGRVPDAREG